jgi:hypothetical protein
MIDGEWEFRFARTVTESHASAAKPSVRIREQGFGAPGEIHGLGRTRLPRLCTKKCTGYGRPL